MALLDLSLVTRCFTSLLDLRIPTYPAWPSLTPLTVSAGAPDLVKAAHALSFYLYHVREDAHTRSQDWQVSDSNPQRFKSMGLTLYYVMSPRSNTQDANERALNDQRVMGLAIKTLRDQATIDDTTSVAVGAPPNAVLVMPLAMRGQGNRLRVLLQPTPSSEAAEYWQAGSNSLRLSAYYEVSATLLEPEVPKIRTGRVLMWGVHSFVRGQPRIDSITNRIEFTLPGETELRRLEISPAEIPYGRTLEIKGVDLKGDATALLIVVRGLDEPVEVDSPWSLASDGNVLTVKVRPNVGSQALLPGAYGAIVRTTARRTLPDGSQRDFDSFSNQVDFAIAPAILSVTAAGAARVIKVDGFQPHTLADSELLVFVGSDRLTRVTGTPAAGEFATPSTPAGLDTVRFRFPASIVAGSVLPLRLVVRGVESGPWWEVAP